MWGRRVWAFAYADDRLARSLLGYTPQVFLRGSGARWLKTAALPRLVWYSRVLRVA